MLVHCVDHSIGCRSHKESSLVAALTYKIRSKRIGLQCLKPVHTAYFGLHNLAENWSWARDVNGRDRDETETRRWYVSRPSRDRDVETETTILLKT